jgi:catechol 2,3-dioxygenase-like lactoylglutathione lyase family enzyme
MDTIVAPAARRTLDSKPIAPSLFAHFVLRSSNMARMVDWYCTVLNMHVVQRNDFICFMTYDDEHHRLAVVNVEGLHEPDAKAWGLAHVAYTFRDIGELLSTWRRLKDKGIEPYRPIHHGPTISLYYRDPDGNSVELQVDRYKTKEECSAYFTTDAFRKNPIGVAFDPATLAAAYEAGVSEDELMAMPDGPPAPLGSARR